MNTSPTTLPLRFGFRIEGVFFIHIIAPLPGKSGILCNRAPAAKRRFTHTLRNRCQLIIGQGQAECKTNPGKFRSYTQRTDSSGTPCRRVTGKIYRNRKKPERKAQREGPKKTRFFRPDLPIRPITGFFRKTATAKRAATSLGPSHPKNATDQHLLNIER